jgi:hypothetical protein
MIAKGFSKGFNIEVGGKEEDFERGMTAVIARVGAEDCWQSG